MNDDRFLERVRHDAGPLRYEPSDIAVSRMRARIRGRIAEPGVVSVLVSWFRPLAATVAAALLAAVVALTSMNTQNEDANAFAEQPVEIVMAGDIYSVGQ